MRPGAIVRMLETYRSTHRGDICLVLKSGTAGSYEVTEILTSAGILMSVLSYHLEFCLASTVKVTQAHLRQLD